MNIAENIKKYNTDLPKDVTLVAVSKTKPNEDLMQAYEAGQRIFGENKIQEMTQKWEELPKDIQWHMIGHVQTNKVKYMAPFVSLVHAVHKIKLLKEINKRAKQENRVIRCLLQLKIAKEDTKYGMDTEQLESIMTSASLGDMKNIKVVGLMGMATFTDDEQQVDQEFTYLKEKFDHYAKLYPEFKILSMGMSGDYKIALDHGTTMVRIGSKIFGERNYH